MLRAMARRRGRGKILVPVPLPICRVMALSGQVLTASPPLTMDNIEGISNARRPDIEPARRDLGFSPRAFGAQEGSEIHSRR
jgi:hypothetical protein